MRERSILVNSLSKTFSVTGWRVGWVVAPPDLTSSIRKVHDFLTVGAAAPLQQAGVLALNLTDSYFHSLSNGYEIKRNLMLEALSPLGFVCSPPQGAYYVMASIENFGYSNDVEFCRHLIHDIGVAAVPGSSFFSDPEAGSRWVRFCFAKRPETIAAAAERLARLAR